MKSLKSIARACSGVSVDWDTMSGSPCINGTRIPVAMVIGRMADSGSLDAPIETWERPSMTRDAMISVLRFAASVIDEAYREELHRKMVTK